MNMSIYIDTSLNALLAKLFDPQVWTNVYLPRLSLFFLALA